MTQALVERPQSAVVIPVERSELTTDELVSQALKIQDAMRKVMVVNTHYGVIPGTPKPTLLQPGAQKLLLLFRLDPQFNTTTDRDGLHLTVFSTCTLYHITSGLRLGSGQGSCSTRETKYAYRSASRACPSCQANAIIKGKAEYGGGWVCFKKKDGCGAKFKDGDPAIESQALGRVPNEDVADQYNTVLKMSNKRALIAAVLNVTAASDIFTQDMEDLRSNAKPEEDAPEGQPATTAQQGTTVPPPSNETHAEKIARVKREHQAVVAGQRREREPGDDDGPLFDQAPA